MTSHTIYDFAVVGAGIAGASVAAELSKDASVLIVEMETQPGYHTTGRSAAMFVPGYGPTPIRALTQASRTFFEAPPEGFVDAPLLSPCDVIMVARGDQMDALDTFIAELSQEIPIGRLSAEEVAHRHPLLKDGYAAAGAFDENTRNIDVGALHHGFLRAAKHTGCQLATNTQVTALTRQDGVWEITTNGDTLHAATVINAAGAWADQLGQLARAETIGLVPKRRTALMVDAPSGIDVDALPMMIDIDEQFYMKADAGKLLISPANEDVSVPCDVQPDELDIAICIDRVTNAFDLDVKQIANSWAGLRSFVADKSPVAGFSTQVDGFFWLAGQGGYGIQSSPALSCFAAAVALGKPVPDDLLAQGVVPETLMPERLIDG